MRSIVLVELNTPASLELVTVCHLGLQICKLKIRHSKLVKLSFGSIPFRWSCIYAKRLLIFIFFYVNVLLHLAPTPPLLLSLPHSRRLPLPRAPPSLSRRLFPTPTRLLPFPSGSLPRVPPSLPCRRLPTPSHHLYLDTPFLTAARTATTSLPGPSPSTSLSRLSSPLRSPLTRID